MQIQKLTLSCIDVFHLKVKADANDLKNLVVQEALDDGFCASKLGDVLDDKLQDVSTSIEELVDDL